MTKRRKKMKLRDSVEKSWRGAGESCGCCLAMGTGDWGSLPCVTSVLTSTDLH